jgi:hypothetical protein
MATAGVYCYVRDACAMAFDARRRQSPWTQHQQIAQMTPTDVVIVDKSRLLFAEDLVRNVPFLRNRPKVFDLSNLNDANIARICAHYG